MNTITKAQNSLTLYLFDSNENQIGESFSSEEFVGDNEEEFTLENGDLITHPHNPSIAYTIDYMQSIKSEIEDIVIGIVIVVKTNEL